MSSLLYLKTFSMKLSEMMLINGKYKCKFNLGPKPVFGLQISELGDSG